MPNSNHPEDDSDRFILNGVSESSELGDFACNSSSDSSPDELTQEAVSSEDARPVQKIQAYPIFDRGGKVARVVEVVRGGDAPSSDKTSPRKVQEEARAFSFCGMVGESKKMKALFETVKRVAPSNATILIYGESGTGKELVAKAIHQSSPRRTHPFIAIDCGALPETL